MSPCMRWVRAVLVLLQNVVFYFLSGLGVLPCVFSSFWRNKTLPVVVVGCNVTFLGAANEKPLASEATPMHPEQH